MNASDPSGHKCVGEVGECLKANGKTGAGFAGPDLPAPGNGAGSELRKKLEKKRDELRKNLNDQLALCAKPGMTIAPSCAVQQEAIETSPDSDGAIHSLLLFWDKVLSPFNDGLDLYDVYRLSSSGGWHYAKVSLNLGPIEGGVAFGAQLYRDSWYESKSPYERGGRALVAGIEAYATDWISDKAGDGAAKLGLSAGPGGAVAGKLFGNTVGTRIVEAFLSKVVNPAISNYTPLGPVFP